jgi:hypothetical protein
MYKKREYTIEQLVELGRQERLTQYGWSLIEAKIGELHTENARLREALQDVGDAVGVTEATIPPGSSPKDIARWIVEALASQD